MQLPSKDLGRKQFPEPVGDGRSLARHASRSWHELNGARHACFRILHVLVNCVEMAHFLFHFLTDVGNEGMVSLRFDSRFQLGPHLHCSLLEFRAGSLAPDARTNLRLFPRGTGTHLPIEPALSALSMRKHFGRSPCVQKETEQSFPCGLRFVLLILQGVSSVSLCSAISPLFSHKPPSIELSIISPRSNGLFSTSKTLRLAL